MSTAFHLWDVASGNVLGEFSTEAGALATIAKLLHAEGPEAVADLALTAMKGRQAPRVVAEGSLLAKRALEHEAAAAQAAPSRARRSGVR
jgi:hypothetical protein